jgi:hypothetical protein
MTWTLDQMWSAMQAHGAVRLLVKELAPNDNSKNQPYLASDPSLAGFSIIPAKTITSAGRNFRADVNLAWLDESGRAWPAPHAKVIQYRRYPEIRLSGFLRGCEHAPGDLMQTRLSGRVLFLGVTADGVVAHVVGPDTPLAQEAAAVIASGYATRVSALHELPMELGLTNEELLLRRLGEVHAAGWLPGCRRRSDGVVVSYKAANAGGMTLEAELGVGANSVPLPDYLGWEVKGLSASDYRKPAPGKAITVITVEPRGGFYMEHGVGAFLERFGYPDRNGKPDRWNFGGRYIFGVPVPLTSARLVIEGYQPSTGLEPDGRLVLLMRDDTEGAIWPFADLLGHWTQKHARAVYVPHERRSVAAGYEYRYSPTVLLGWSSDLQRFVHALWEGAAYYDPACKVEGASTASPKIKRRNQFRISLTHLDQLYERIAWRDVAGS